MALDDLVNKAKDLLAGASGKADEATAAAEAGAPEQAAAASAESSSMIDKAKEFLTDERIDQAREAIVAKTPDQVDSVVNTVADKAKEMNN